MSSILAFHDKDQRLEGVPGSFPTDDGALYDAARPAEDEKSPYVPPGTLPFFIGGFCGAFAWLLLIFCCRHEAGHTPVTPLFTGGVYSGMSGVCCLLAMVEDNHPMAASFWRSALLAGAMMIPFIPFHLLGFMF